MDHVLAVPVMSSDNIKIYHEIPENKGNIKNPVVTIGNFDGVHTGHRKIIETLLLKAREQNRLKRRLTWLKKPHVLLLDEVGYEPLTPEQAHVFFQLINARYEIGFIVMISNKIFAKWAELMSDEAVATAMLDRLLHHAHVVSLKADSYRMKERLRVGAANTGTYAFE